MTKEARLYVEGQKYKRYIWFDQETKGKIDDITTALTDQLGCKPTLNVLLTYLIRQVWDDMNKDKMNTEVKVCVNPYL